MNSYLLDREYVLLLMAQDTAAGPVIASHDDAAIAKAVIALAHSLKLTVIAEGVETEEQLGFLCAQQCDQMQGYYLSCPVSAEQVEKCLPG